MGVACLRALAGARPMLSMQEPEHTKLVKKDQTQEVAHSPLWNNQYYVIYTSKGTGERARRLSRGRWCRAA